MQLYNKMKLLTLLLTALLVTHSHCFLVDPLYPEFSSYMARYEVDYSEVGTPPPIPQDFFMPVTKDWSFVGSGEAPYLATIIRNLTLEEEEDQEILTMTKGTACGGVFINDATLMTLCACVAAWYNFGRGSAPVYSTDSVIFAPTLHVLHSTMYFTARANTLKTTLKRENPQKPEHSAFLTCDQVDNFDDPIQPLAKASAVALMQFYPKIRTLGPDDYVPWPPKPIFYDDERRGTLEPNSFKLNIKPSYVSFGFKIAEKNSALDKEVDHLKLRAISVELQIKNRIDCNQDTGFILQPSPLPGLTYDPILTCFAPSIANHSLCEGLPGSPIIVGGFLHGLAATTIRCGRKFDAKQRGPFMSTTIGGYLKRFVEEQIDHKRLNTGWNEPSMLWRETVSKKRTIEYDLDLEEFESEKPRPRSAGSILLASLATVTIFSLIYIDLLCGILA